MWCFFSGSFGQVRGSQPNYGGAYPGTPNYGSQPGPPPPPKRLDPDSIPSPVSLYCSHQYELLHLLHLIIYEIDRL